MQDPTAQAVWSMYSQHRTDKEEQMEEIITLITRVIGTLDTIPVCGIDNQDKFVGCCQALRSVQSKIAKLAEKEDTEEVRMDG